LLVSCILPQAPTDPECDPDHFVGNAKIITNQITRNHNCVFSLDNANKIKMFMPSYIGCYYDSVIEIENVPFTIGDTIFIDLETSIIGNSFLIEGTTYQIFRIFDNKSWIIFNETNSDTTELYGSLNFSLKDVTYDSNFLSSICEDFHALPWIE